MTVEGEVTPWPCPPSWPASETDRLRPPPQDRDRRGEGRARRRPRRPAAAAPAGAVRLAKRVAHRVLGERGVARLRGFLRVDEAL